MPDRSFLVSPNRQLSFVAFYADCRHEVQPVKEGYRLALTYNLILEGGKTAIAAAAAEPATVDALIRCLRDHFAIPRPSRRYASPNDAHNSFAVRLPS